MELSRKQKEIVETQEKKVVVIAAAAAGKTRVLTERLRYILNNGTDSSKVVAITFTNLAAEELRERLGECAQGCFIGTVHSYCNNLLRAAGIDTQKFIDNEKFDELFEEVNEHPECIKEVDYLLLDEAQDSNEHQFEFMLNMVQPHSFMLVGDIKQSIYRFASARPDILLSITKDPEVHVFDLNENYRNGSNILSYARMIIRQNGYDYFDNSIAMSKEKGKVIEVDYSPRGVAGTIKKMGNYGKWFILCRWNKDIPEICAALEDAGVPHATFRRADFSSNAEIRDKMAENTVKVMTIHQSKGLERENVVVVGATFMRNGTMDEAAESVCVNYVAATRAKELLVWTKKKPQYKKRAMSWE